MISYGHETEWICRDELAGLIRKSIESSLDEDKQALCSGIQSSRNAVSRLSVFKLGRLSPGVVILYNFTFKEI